MQTFVIKTEIFLAVMTVKLRLRKVKGKTSFCWAKSVQCYHPFGTAHICLAEKHSVTPIFQINRFCKTSKIFSTTFTPTNLQYENKNNPTDPFGQAWSPFTTPCYLFWCMTACVFFLFICLCLLLVVKAVSIEQFVLCKNKEVWVPLLVHWVFKIHDSILNCIPKVHFPTYKCKHTDVVKYAKKRRKNFTIYGGPYDMK